MQSIKIPGTVHLAGYLSTEEQKALSDQCFELGAQPVGRYRPSLNNGSPMNLEMLASGGTGTRRTTNTSRCAPTTTANPSRRYRRTSRRSPQPWPTRRDRTRSRCLHHQLLRRRRQARPPPGQQRGPPAARRRGADRLHLAGRHRRLRHRRAPPMGQDPNGAAQIGRRRRLRRREPHALPRNQQDARTHRAPRLRTRLRADQPDVPAERQVGPPPRPGTPRRREPAAGSSLDTGPAQRCAAPRM